MKTIYKTTAMVIIALILNVKNSSAQEPNTKESIRTQYLNNKVPGLKYSPSPQQKRSIQSTDSKQNTTGNIRDVLFTGGVPTNKSKASITSKTTVARSSNVKLTSDEKAVEPEKNKQEIKNTIPSQGGVNEAVETPQKATPIKATAKQKGNKKVK